MATAWPFGQGFHEYAHTAEPPRPVGVQCLGHLGFLSPGAVGGSGKSDSSLQLSDWLVGTVNGLAQPRRPPWEREPDSKQATFVLVSEEIEIRGQR